MKEIQPKIALESGKWCYMLPQKLRSSKFQSNLVESKVKKKLNIEKEKKFEKEKER